MTKALSMWLPRDAYKKDPGLYTGHQQHWHLLHEVLMRSGVLTHLGLPVTPGGERNGLGGEDAAKGSGKALELVLQKAKAKITAGGTAGLVLLCKGTPGMDSQQSAEWLEKQKQYKEEINSNETNSTYMFLCTLGGLGPKEAWVSSFLHYSVHSVKQGSNP